MLADRIAAAGIAEGIPCRRGGTYVVMEGPQFSSLAESRLYRSWEASVIGMTNMPEAKLAREAELGYATIAMVTDYNSWHPEHDMVDVASVIRVLNANREHVQRLVGAARPRLPGRARGLPDRLRSGARSCDHDRARDA